MDTFDKGFISILAGAFVGLGVGLMAHHRFGDDFAVGLALIVLVVVASVFAAVLNIVAD